MLRKVVEGRFQNLVLHFVHISTSLTKFILINTITMSVLVKGPVNKCRGGGGAVGRSREEVGHEVLSLMQGVGRAIFSYP